MAGIFSDFETLRPCAALAGAHHVYDVDPSIEILSDVFCIPPVGATRNDWGVYRPNGTLVESTAFRRGADNHAAVVSQALLADYDFRNAEEAPDEIYFYAGKLHPHYGHFLLSTLSRFWPFATSNRPAMKILIHEDVELARWFGLPHFDFCFKNLGLAKSDFYNCDKITHVRRLVVPQPAFVEEWCGHTIFSALCNQIGRSALAKADTSPLDQPIYLSKSKLPHGVWRFENENEVERILEDRGIQIVYPEKLSLEEQISIFVRHRIVIGSMSSGLHTSMFSWSQPKIIGISHSPNVLSNYTICDKINKIPGSYFYSLATTKSGHANQFTMNCRFTQPQKIAKDILKMTDHDSKLGNFHEKISQQPHHVSSERPLGIAITTYNRRHVLERLVKQLFAFTKNKFILVVCDDGSSDGTVEYLRSNNLFYVTGKNKGVAWNKNRGIFALKEIYDCERIILLDDDAILEKDGWDVDWVNAINRFGHICHWLSDSRESIVGGSGTADDPYICGLIHGVGIGLSRRAISLVGYMDVRFGKYGHEHTDYSIRFRRAGFGGILRRDGKQSRDYFLAIKGSVSVDATTVSHKPFDISEGETFLSLSHGEPITRNPWRSDDEMFEFMKDINNACVQGDIFTQNSNVFCSNTYLALNEDVRSANLDPWDHFINFGFRENRKFMDTPKSDTPKSINEATFSAPGINDLESTARSLGLPWPLPPIGVCA